MTTTLRIMLDQLVAPTDPDLTMASRELARALVLDAPQGCVVEGVVPSAPDDRIAGLAVAGLVGVHRAALPRRELAAALQLGIASGLGAGMIHSPTLFAPLVRHDRVHDHDQTVVTVWDLLPWEAPGELPRSVVAWHKAMLKRAVKHADAIVVPTHEIAVRLAEVAKVGDRVRVIAGASPATFAVPADEVGRRRTLGLPEGFILLSGRAAATDALALGLAGVGASGIELPVVVIDAGDGEEPVIADLAAAGGIPSNRIHVRGSLEVDDRAAVLGAALAFVAPSERTTFPWRVVDALTLGVPVIAAESPVHAEVIVDGGLIVEPQKDAVADALHGALGSTDAADRLAVLAGDRGRAFSWSAAADKVWQLHADL